MKKLNSKQTRFYKEVAKILWEQWDPIKVNDGTDDWNDEYDSYVPHTFALAMNNNDAIKIANHLTSLVTQNIGMAAKPEHDLKVAKLILATKAIMLDG